MHGFFGKKQYEAIAPSMFTTKFGSPEKVWGQQEFNGENPQFRKR